MVIPCANLESFSNHNQKSGRDPKYLLAAEKYLDCKKRDGMFDRIESRLLKAFVGMPQTELTGYSMEKTIGGSNLDCMKVTPNDTRG